MSRFNLCDCPAGFSAAPERHAPDCPGRSGAGKPSNFVGNPCQTIEEVKRVAAMVSRAAAEPELRKIVTEALVGMIAAVTSSTPPADAPLPDFIQAPVDRAVTRIAEHFSRLQAEIARLQQRLNVADEQVDILSGGLRLMTSFGSGTNIAGVKTVAKQTLNRAAGVTLKSGATTPQ